MPDTPRDVGAAEVLRLLHLLREDQKEGRRETQDALNEIRRDMATKSEVQRYAEENNRRFAEAQAALAEVDKERQTEDDRLHRKVEKVRDDLTKRLDDEKARADAYEADLKKSKSQRSFQVVTLVLTSGLATISAIVSGIALVAFNGGGP